MSLIDVGVIAAATYFFGFGIGFVAHPEFVKQFALSWSDPAGRTEVRCYYGAVSLALGGFLVVLLHDHDGRPALTGVLLLASAVFVTRVIGTVVDGGRAHPYTKMAIPVEGLFVLAVGLVRLLG